MKNLSMLEGALFWAANGFKVIPVHSVVEGRCTCKNVRCNSIGKHPQVTHWPKWATKDEYKIRQYWQFYPSANVGIVAGNGLHVLDVDTKSGGIETLEELDMLYGKIKTLTVRTGSGGLHKYMYSKKLRVGNKVGFLPGLDWKSERGFVVAPPSIHSSGNQYKVLEPKGDSLAEVPEWLKTLLITRGKEPKGKAPFNFGDKVSVGGRNNLLTGIAGRLRAQNFNQDELRGEIHLQNKIQCSPPLNNNEVERIISSIENYPERPVKRDWDNLKKDVNLKDYTFRDITSDMLPKSIKDLILQKSEATGLPKAVLAIPVLTTFSAILGSAYLVRPRPKSDHYEYLNLWGLIVAESGSRKTTALSLAEEAINNIESKFDLIRKECIKKNGDSKASLEAELSILKSQLRQKDLEEEKRNLIEQKIQHLHFQKDQLGVLPKYLLYTSDTTPESLAEICSFNKRGIILFRDELDGLFQLFSKNNFETLRAMLNEGWNGGRRFRFTRIGRGISDVERMTISILGGVQPEILALSFREEFSKGTSGDGLLARFQLLISYQSSNIGRIKKDFVDPIVKERFESLISKLHEITNGFNLESSFGPEELNLSSEAFAIYKRFEEDTNAKLQANDFFSSAYRAHFSKLTKLILALGAQFHIIECLDSNKKISSEISIDSMSLAFKWVGFLDLQAQKIYSMMKDNHTGVKVLIKRIQNGDIKNFDTVRTVYRKEWSGLKDKEDVLAALEFLAKYNWVHVSFGSPQGGGRKTEFIQIHPDLLKEQTDNTDGENI